jgi:hypothetical protein
MTRRRVRILSTGHGRKNDDADAVSVGIAARSARTLTSVTVEGTVTALRAIVDHRRGDHHRRAADPDGAAGCDSGAAVPRRVGDPVGCRLSVSVSWCSK